MIVDKGRGDQDKRYNQLKYIYKRALATFERDVLRGRTDINRAAMSTSARVMGNDRLRAGRLPIVSEVVEA